MAQKKVGRAVSWRPLSSVLALFRLAPQDGTPFPHYLAGQYMALGRADCRLTRRELDPSGRARYVPDLDPQGQPRRGPVMHSYSIASAPWETAAHGWLEFYVVLEGGEEYPGRLTESLFRIRPGGDDGIEYVDRIVGDFTLEKRAAGFRNVVMVGTGTGLAPFAGMVKQLHFESAGGAPGGVRYTLLHANRTRDELAYHEELQEIEAGARFDFLYVPAVSRPSAGDREDPTMGLGRANNILRRIFDMPLREEEDLRRATAAGGDVARAEAALERAVRPKLPARVSWPRLRERLDPGSTVILTCGNPSSMEDIGAVAGAQGIRFEKEDWKPAMPSRA